MNDPNLFPGLDLDKCMQAGYRWGRNPIIRKIKIHPDDSSFIHIDPIDSEYFAGYVIIAEIDNVDRETMDTSRQDDYSKKFMKYLKEGRHDLINKLRDARPEGSLISYGHEGLQNFFDNWNDNNTDFNDELNSLSKRSLPSWSARWFEQGENPPSRDIFPYIPYQYWTIYERHNQEEPVDKVVIAESGVDNLSNVENGFCCIGDYWKVKYQGQETYIQNRERVKYIVHLIDNPGRIFNPIELVQLVKGQTEKTDEYYSNMSSAELEKEGLSELKLTDIGLTKENIENFKEQITTLFENIEFAKKNNKNKIGKAETAFRNMTHYFMKEYGILVRITKTGPLLIIKTRLKEEAEKARINCWKQIEKAKKDIKNKKMTKLYEHLKHIKTGNTIVYQIAPAAAPAWDIRF